MLATWNNIVGRLASPDAVEPEAAARLAVVTATALAVAGVLPPLALGALLLTAARFGVSGPPPYDGIALVAAAGAAPALTGMAVARRGLARVRSGFANGCEHPQLIARILVATAVLASVFGLIAAQPRNDRLAACLSIAAMALVFAWLMLLHAILRPTPSLLRRHLAGAADIALVSGLLHAGGGLTAAWFPLYFWTVFDSGYRFGFGAVAETSLLSLAGFAAMAATTPFWAHRPILSAGLLGALVLLAADVALLLRNVLRARAERAAANIAGGRFLALVGRELRRPVEAILRAGAGAAEQPHIVAEIGRSATALLAQCEDIVELADIEAGGAAPEAEPFDLHELVGGAIAALRGQAAARGVEIALRLDPRVSHRLRGCPRLLRRVLIGLASAAIDRAAAPKVRASLDEIRRDGDTVWLRFAVRADRIDVDPAAFDHIGLAVAARIAALLGGRIERVPAAGGGILLAAEITCEIDRAQAAAGLDLGHRPVLIASEDAQFAGELGTALVAWQADPRWIGGLAAAESHLASLGADFARAVLIVDGRCEVLQALSRSHRLAAAHAVFVLLVVEESWVGSLVGFADGEIAGILAAPVTPAVLASALHALPYAAAAPVPAPAAAVEPPHAPVARPRPLAPAPPPAPGPLRILVADDNAANRKIVERILGAGGHTVDLAESGEEMLAVLEAYKVDLVLIDLNLSGSGGYEAAELCRMTHPGLPILALTADVGSEIERRCVEAGIDAVLTKPIEPSRLIAAVETALGRGEATASPDEPSAEVHQISSHPRFGADDQAIVDERAVAALWSLGRGSDFFREVVEAFCADAREMLEQIKNAAAAAHAQDFAAAVDSLRSCAANVGAVRLCDVLGALRDVGVGELRRDGGAHVGRLTAELAKLNGVLREYLQEAELAGR